MLQLTCQSVLRNQHIWGLYIQRFREVEEKQLKPIIFLLDKQTIKLTRIKVHLLEESLQITAMYLTISEIILQSSKLLERF